MAANMAPPKIVHERHLQHGKLLNSTQIKKAKEYFKNNPAETLYTGEGDIPFPVLKTAENKLLVLFAKPSDLLVENPSELRTDIAERKKSNGIYPLGIGADGVVVAAQSLENGSWCAAKFETFAKEHEYKIESIAMEQEALKTQPGVFKGSARIETKEHNTITIVTAMKLGPGKDLNEAMVHETGNNKGVNKLELPQRLELALKVVKATGKLPQKNIVHRDLKPKNIMANLDDGKVEVMLIDFGGAVKLNNKGEFKNEGQRLGTGRYTAQELGSGSFGVDIQVHSENSMAFSLGISLAEIFTKRHLTEMDPNWRSHYTSLPLPSDKSYSVVLGCFYDVLSDKAEVTSKQNVIEKEMNSVVRKLIHLDPNQRINCALALKELEIIKKYHDLLKKNNIPLENTTNAKSIIEHINQIKNEHPNLKNDLSQIEKRLNSCHHSEVIYKAKLFNRRLNNYVNGLDSKDSPTKEHKMKMESLQKQLKALNKNSSTYTEKVNDIMAKVYAEKSLYDIDIATTQLRDHIRKICLIPGKENSCEDAKKIILEIELLKSQKPMTSDKISKLYDKMDELKKTIRTIISDSDKPIRTQLLPTTRYINPEDKDEKKFAIYRQLHDLAPKTQLNVVAKEKKPLREKIKKWIKLSVSSKQQKQITVGAPSSQQKNSQPPSSTVTAPKRNVPFPTYELPPTPQTSVTTPSSIQPTKKGSGRPLPPLPVVSATPNITQPKTKSAGRPLPIPFSSTQTTDTPPPVPKRLANPLLRELNKGPIRSESQPSPVPTSRVNLSPILPSRDRLETDNFLAKLEKSLQAKPAALPNSCQISTSQVQPPTSLSIKKTKPSS